MSILGRFNTDGPSPNLHIRTGGGNDGVLLNAGGFGDVVIDGGSGDDGLSIVDYYGSVLHVRALGGPGNDAISTAGGNDVIDGGDGNDSIFAGSGNNIVIGGRGNDSITAGGGVDWLDGGDGDDTLRGWGGDDELSGGPGNDLIEGMGGDDHLVDDGFGQPVGSNLALRSPTASINFPVNNIQLTSPTGLAVGQNDILFSIEGRNDSIPGFPNNLLFANLPSGESRGFWDIDTEVGNDLFNDGTNHSDWQALGRYQDAANNRYLYIADIGDDAMLRTSVTIYRVVEPTIDSAITGHQGTLTISGSVRLQYPQIDTTGTGAFTRARDAEAMMVDPVTGDILIFSKSEPNRGGHSEPNPHLYRAKAPTTWSGNLYPLVDEGVFRALPSGLAATIDSPPPTDADVSMDGKEVAIKQGDHVYYYLRHNSSVPLSELLTKGRPSQIMAVAGQENHQSIAFAPLNAAELVSTFYVASQLGGGGASPKSLLRYVQSNGLDTLVGDTATGPQTNDGFDTFAIINRGSLGTYTDIVRHVVDISGMAVGKHDVIEYWENSGSVEIHFDYDRDHEPTNADDDDFVFSVQKGSVAEKLSAEAIDALFAAVRNYNSGAPQYDPQFDLDEDGDIDGPNVANSDAEQLITGFLSTVFGDANLDAVADATDLAIWHSSSFHAGTGWSTGDFQGDTATDVSDYNLWFVNRMTSVSSQAAMISAGDINHNSNEEEPTDVDVLYSAIAIRATADAGTRAWLDSLYDLDGNGVLNTADVDHLVQIEYGTDYGDANLDGIINGEDYVAIMRNWYVVGTTWAQGNFDGNTKTDVLDYLDWYYARMTLAGAPIPGDLTYDGVVDAADIDAMFRGVEVSLANTNYMALLVSYYDLNGDGTVNYSDVDYLVYTILETVYGDLDLDGDVDFSDFVTFNNFFGFHVDSWSFGDFNGDGVVDELDYDLLMGNWGFGT